MVQNVTPEWIKGLGYECVIYSGDDAPRHPEYDGVLLVRKYSPELNQSIKCKVPFKGELGENLKGMIDDAVTSINQEIETMMHEAGIK